MPALQTADAPSWYDFITKFDNAYNAFYTNYQGLMAQGPYIQQNHPELLGWYETELQNASNAAYKLEQLKSLRDTVAGWLNEIGYAIGQLESYASGLYSSAMQAIGLQGLGGLGQAVTIGITVAAALAALAVIVSAINQMYNDAQRINALKDAEANGATPQQAAALVAQTFGAPGASSGTLFGFPISLMIWGAIAIILGPPLIKAFTEGRR